MRVNTLKVAVLFLGAMMLPVPTAFMGIDLVSNAVAANDTINMAVTANVANTCNFTSGNITLAFGAYDPIVTNVTAPLDAATTFTFRCTKGGTASIAMGLGSNPVSTQRMLANSTYRLNYDVYQDAGRTVVWAAGVDAKAYTAVSSSPQTFNVYGRIPGAQDAQYGNYTDTVVITATYTP